MKEVIKSIIKRWFLSEPALFSMYCAQEVLENTNMKCPVRCGDGKIEYNPDMLSQYTFGEVEDLFKLEVIRIFMKHPYERQPDDCSKQATYLGSNATLADNYESLKDSLNLIPPEQFELPSGECFEWYSKKIDKNMPGNGGEGESDGEGQSGQSSAQNQNSSRGSKGGGKGKSPEFNQDQLDSFSDAAKNWREDELRSSQINNIINNTTSWGSIPGNIVDEIIASTKARIDYRTIIQGFRSKILSSETRLTRMRPNRRTGFANMGTVRKFTTNLLVAIDVSGSVSNEDLCNIYGVINKFFKYGITNIDTVQFDTVLGNIVPIKKKKNQVEVLGRGGTSFQPIFDYLEKHHEYDGVIVFTDGYAPVPTITNSVTADVLWVCTTKECYEHNKSWMTNLGRCCWIRIDN